MDIQELKAIQATFEQGIRKLKLLSDCLGRAGEHQGLDIRVEAVDERRGELSFSFAGMMYYVKIRITDRGVDDVGASYRVPNGWLDWGRYTIAGHRESPDETNYYDDRGILCEEDRQEFYCSFADCGDERVVNGLTRKLQRLAAGTIAANNASAI